MKYNHVVSPVAFRKYHYWRGFRSGMIIGALICGAIVLIVQAVNPPNYTMTQAQYDAADANFNSQSPLGDAPTSVPVSQTQTPRVGRKD